MKKTLLFIVLILGTSLSSFANEISIANQGQPSITLIANEANLPENNINIKTSENSKIDSSIQNSAKKKKKKKLKTWQYIVGGVLIALIVVIWVVTGGEGFSSR